MKTMRFLSIAAIALAGLMMTGCSSEDDFVSEVMEQAASKDNIVTLTTTVNRNGSTADAARVATRALAADGTKTFAVGEKIAVIYDSEDNTKPVKAVSKPLTAANITNGGKSASFTVTLTNPKAGGNVKYIYPASMTKEKLESSSSEWFNSSALNEQDGTLSTISEKFDAATYEGTLTESAGLPASVTLENKFAILALTLKNSAGTQDITNNITGLNITETYTLYGTSQLVQQSRTVSRTAAAGPIYIVIQPVANHRIKITAPDGTKNYVKALTGKTYEANNGYSVSWKMSDAGKVGQFTSSSSGDQIFFAKGNLQYNASEPTYKWRFAEHQYDKIGTSGETWDTSTWVDLFGWGTWTGANPNPTNTSNNYYDYSWDESDFIKESQLVSQHAYDWRTPSTDEWAYIINNRKTSTVSGTNNARWTVAMINGKNGYILFPDIYFHPAGVTALDPSAINKEHITWGVNRYSTEDWKKMEAAGAVFLPSANGRSGNKYSTPLSDVGDVAYYWSKSPVSGNDTQAYRTYLSVTYISPSNKADRSTGYAVRLVRSAE